MKAFAIKSIISTVYSCLRTFERHQASFHERLPTRGGCCGQSGEQGIFDHPRGEGLRLGVGSALARGQGAENAPGPKIKWPF